MSTGSAVNRPVNEKVKEQDINNKLQLFGIFSAFSNGKVPSNKQIDVALNSALASKALASPSTQLSSEGRELVADLKDVINQAKHLLLTKNDGNLLQDFIWDCQHIDGGNATKPGAPIDKATAQQHGNEALDGLKTLGTLLLSNGQFRKLLQDAQILARDMAGDAAQKAANKVNPSEEKLSQIDQPAEDNTWHDVPDLSRENLRSQAKDAYGKNKPFSRGDAQAAVERGADDAQNQPDNQAGAREGASTAAQNLKDQARAGVPDETQEKAKNAKNALAQNSKNYLNKKMPQERRDQSIWRMKKMVTEIQGHSDYQQAIETLLSLAETYAGHGRDMSQQGAGTVKGAHDDNNLSRAEANLKTLIERFANSTSMDDLIDSINNIYRDADRDPELKNWFKSLDKYIRRCLQEQGYILQDSATDEWNAIYDKGRYLFRERYRDHTDRILDEFKFMSTQFDEDPQNKAFGQAVQKLFLDLGQDSDGKPTFKPHLIKDLTEVIIPGIFENTRYVPLPRIEVSDPMIDAIVENIVIESDNLFPNVMELGSDNYYRLGRKKIANKHDNKVMIAASGIQMDLRDVAYYVKKKQGFPSITDKGVMDIFLGGEGFSFKLAARNAQKSDRTHFVVVDKVDVTIKNLNIKVKQSNHKLLFGIAKPILLKVMKPVIQKVIEKQIKDAFEKGDAYAYSVHQDAQKAAKQAKQDPENAQNIFSFYQQAWQKKALAKKEAAKEKSSNMNVNVAMTQQDSMFKQIKLPGGISTKATEYKELAAKGNRWESPVFGIGSAQQSSNIPKLAQVSRKPHNVASGGVRGGNHPGQSGQSMTEQVKNDNAGYGGQQAGYGGQQAGYGAQQAGYGANTGNTGAFGANTGTTPNAGAGGAAFSQQVDSAFDTNKNIGVANGGAANNQGMYHDTVTQH